MPGNVFRVGFNKKADANQAAIVSALKETFGDHISVHDLKNAGAGCPDLLIGFLGQNHLMEVKKEKGARGGQSKAKLNKRQDAWTSKWRGTPVVIARTPTAAVDCLRDFAKARRSVTVLGGRADANGEPMVAVVEAQASVSGVRP